jgi:hypothetical protein
VFERSRWSLVPLLTVVAAAAWIAIRAAAKLDCADSLDAP